MAPEFRQSESELREKSEDNGETTQLTRRYLLFRTQPRGLFFSFLSCYGVFIDQGGLRVILSPSNQERGPGMSARELWNDLGND